MSTAALLVLLALALIRLPLAYLLTILLPDAAVSPVVHYVTTIGQSLLLFALPGWLIGRRPARLPLRRGNICLWVLAALCLGAAATVTLKPLNRWWAELLALQDSPIPAASGGLEKLLQLLAYAVVPAVAEEMFFRGALLRSLRQERGSRAALLIATLAFALMHGSMAGLPGHLALSLLLTLLMLCTDRLIVPATAHLMYNVAVLSGLQAGETAAWLRSAALALGCLGMAAAVRWEKRGKMPLHEGLLTGLILAIMAAAYLI